MSMCIIGIYGSGWLNFPLMVVAVLNNLFQFLSYIICTYLLETVLRYPLTEKHKLLSKNTDTDIVYTAEFVQSTSTHKAFSFEWFSSYVFFESWYPCRIKY